MRITIDQRFINIDAIEKMIRNFWTSFGFHYVYKKASLFISSGIYKYARQKSWSSVDVTRGKTVCTKVKCKGGFILLIQTLYEV